MPPPVLLVHGFASSYERNWREPGWVDLLEESGRDVIGVDLPGHGDAAKPHEPAAYTRMDLVVEQHLPDDPVDAIAFSLGAWLTLVVASRAPQRFSRIVVGGVGANLFRGESPEALAVAVETGDAPDGAPEAAGAFARFARAPGNDPAALAACLRGAVERIEPASLAAVTCPVLVVLGDRDFAGPAEPLVAALPDPTLVVVAGLDHFATPKDFRFVDAALRFLGCL